MIKPKVVEKSGSKVIEAVNSTSETFYGWWIVCTGIVIMFIASGIGFYGHGVILDPLRESHGWSKGLISSAITFYFFISAVIGVFAGKTIDRFGSKPVLVFGSICMGLGLILLSVISEVWQLYGVYFLMAVGFSCTSLLPVNALITNWFIRKRGLTMSLTMTGLSLGGIFIVPAATFMIAKWGIKETLPILGVLYWLIIPVSIIFIKQRPQDLNQLPDGCLEKDDSSRPVKSSLSLESQMRVWTVKQAMGTLTFWSIVITFMLALGSQIAFCVHQVSFLGKYLGLTGAALAVSITAGASIIGRLILGQVIDRYDNRKVMMLCLVSQAIAVLTLAYNQHIVILYMGTLIFGLTMGSILMMQSLIVGECFGVVSFGTVSGIAGLFSGAGAAFGPTIAGVIFDATQSYRQAFILFAAASAIATFTIYFAKPPKTV